LSLDIFSSAGSHYHWLDSWGRFHETVSAGIYGHRVNGSNTKSLMF
jgi:hypothetical protein